MKKMLLALCLLLGAYLPAHAVVNLNTATAEQLESLNGIGPAKAEAIIEYRKKNGNFKTVDDLNNVPGIGDKTMAKLKPELTVTGTTTVAPAAPVSNSNSNAAKKK